ncbi:CidA/LrgA family protein [Alkalihalobacillus sp. CinArs1]|uniref:CidA/LrgA family protein n=1 Tax=Alkalihalobacillus sp. CinArs1 TaxID=2995314 RepID=UPI0022DDD244|nr:CidA/LrgA family protein [Alkalihalobacillus sp. CinArs1]
MNLKSNLFITILQLALLFGFYLIGVSIQKLFGLLIPGSVIGMVLLLVCLYTNLLPEQWVSKGATFLLNHLPLFFIPVTVGVMNHLDFFNGKSLWLIPIVLVSTWIIMITTGFIGQTLVNRKE